ncbi:hypothetical protein M422DRAFT_22933 [Sphaerobolus stellatus SS14]|nr:hypothetical protein M422DRAFT_22933 [Sphaerobolus stellatus SS14]
MSDTPKLSLERPYKDDKGDYILNVIDITQDGEYILEPRENTRQRLGEDFRRIFVERGVDFFDRLKATGSIPDNDRGTDGKQNLEEDKEKGKDVGQTEAMTPEQLLQMRREILPQLHVAYGEMSQARDLLSVLLSTSQHTSTLPDLPTGSLKSTVVSKPPDIPSVQAFNAQLVVSGKDEALREAAGAFKSAAESMERVRVKGERYWRDALKMRHENWGLIPAPLLPGAPTGKGADKTARDFWITFGLAESPIIFRQKAVAHLGIHDSEEMPLIFPRHSSLRMRISMVTTDENGDQQIVHDTNHRPDTDDLNTLLNFARDEVVDQEIFSQLIKEAATLPTAAVSVSERLIVIELAQGLELRFELVDQDVSWDATKTGQEDSAMCDLIHAGLLVLLLRSHKFARTQRLSVMIAGPKPRTLHPQLLVPVVNALQYKLFCDRVHAELVAMDRALSRAGIPCKLRFNTVGEAGAQLVDILRGEDRTRMGGDAVLRVNNIHTLHFTFTAPSNLIVVLPQATLTITSVPQLCQLLRDEVERSLLESICKVGYSVSQSAEGTWFVDKLSNRAVGRWDSTVLTCKLSFESDDGPTLTCLLVEVRGSQENKTLRRYESQNDTPFLSWIRESVSQACTNDQSLPK